MNKNAINEGTNEEQAKRELDRLMNLIKLEVVKSSKRSRTIVGGISGPEELKEGDKEPVPELKQTT